MNRPHARAACMSALVAKMQGMPQDGTIRVDIIGTIAWRRWKNREAWKGESVDEKTRLEIVTTCPYPVELGVCFVHPIEDAFVQLKPNISDYLSCSPPAAIAICHLQLNTTRHQLHLRIYNDYITFPIHQSAHQSPIVFNNQLVNPSIHSFIHSSI